eukprot:1094252-Prymnesium_polylepis.1
MRSQRVPALAALLALARAASVHDAAGLAPPDGADALLANASPLRLVVLACKRPAGLGSLLGSLLAVGDAGGFMGHRVPLDILIDLPKGRAQHDAQTLALARSFGWTHGPLAVSPKQRHAGILGQWLSIVPRSAEDWFVVLEDDLAVSPCFYRYLLAARNMYGDRDDVAGVTLQAPLPPEHGNMAHSCHAPTHDERPA